MQGALLLCPHIQRKLPVLTSKVYGLRHRTCTSTSTNRSSLADHHHPCPRRFTEIVLYQDVKEPAIEPYCGRNQTYHSKEKVDIYCTCSLVATLTRFNIFQYLDEQRSTVNLTSGPTSASSPPPPPPASYNPFTFSPNRPASQRYSNKNHKTSKNVLQTIRLQAPRPLDLQPRFGRPATRRSERREQENQPRNRRTCRQCWRRGTKKSKPSFSPPQPNPSCLIMLTYDAQSSVNAGAYAGLNGYKRSSQDVSKDERKTSWNEQKTAPGILGGMWNSFTKGT